MSSTHRFLCPLFVLSLAALGACKGSVRIDTELRERDDTLMVEIKVNPTVRGTARLKGHKAFEEVRPIEMTESGGLASVPLASVPMGKHEIAVSFEGQRTGTLISQVSSQRTFTYERKPLAPYLKLRPSAQAGAKELKCKGDLFDTETKLPLTAAANLSVEFAGCTGCVVEIGGQKFEIKGQSTPALIDLSKAAGAASIHDMKIPFSISREGATKVVNLEVVDSLLAVTVLRRVAESPITFPGDTATTAPRSALILSKDGIIASAGSAKLVREVDLIGVTETREVSLGTCGIYQKENDPSSKIEVDHKGRAIDATLYDRRTAKQVGRRSFPPENLGCREKLTDGRKTMVSTPSTKDIQAWAQSFLK